MGHVLIENRSDLVVDAELTEASGTAERDAALLFLRRQDHPARRLLDEHQGTDAEREDLRLAQDLRRLA